MNLKNLADLSPDAMLIAKLGRVVFANLAAQMLFRQAGEGAPLEGRMIDDLWEPNPVHDCAHSDAAGRLAASVVSLKFHEVAANFELSATRSLTGSETEFAVRLRQIDYLSGGFYSPHSVANHSQQELDRILAAIDHSPDAIDLVDAQTGEFLYVNEAACSMFSFSREEMLARGPLGVLEGHGVDASHLNLQSRLIAHPNQPLREEIELLRQDGSRIHIEATRRALCTANGWLIVSSTREVTERKNTLLRLEQFRAALDATEEAISLIDPQTLTYIEVNAAACRIRGQTREDVMSRGPLGFSTQHAHVLKERYADLINRYPDTVTEVSAVLRADGTEIQVEGARRALKLKDQWLIVSVVRDVTERNAAKARLERFKAALDQTEDAVFLVDVKSLRYLYFNEAAIRLRGMSAETLMKIGPLGLKFHTEDELRTRYANLIAKFPQTVIEERVDRRVDGSEIQVEVARRALNSDGQWMVITVIRDITARRAAQERLEWFRAAMDHSLDTLTLVDRASMRCIDVNETTLRRAGLTRAEYLEIPPHERVAGMTRSQLEALYDDVIAQSPNIQVTETRLFRPDGKLYPAETTRAALKLGGRWIIVTSTRDISERHAAHAAAERFRAAVDASGDGIALIDPESLTVIDLNAVTASFFGLSRHLAVGISASSLESDSAADGELAAMYQRIMDMSPQVEVTEIPLRNKDGEVLELERRRRAFMSDGKWLIFSSYRDVTRRKQQQTRVERLALALDLSSDGLMLIDHQTLTVVDVNQAACRMLRTNREHALNRSPYGPNWRHKTRASIELAFDALIEQAPRPEVEEIEGLMSDGSRYPLEVTTQALRLHGRWIVAVTLRDISERTLAQQRLEWFRAALDQSADALVLVDRETLSFVDANAVAISRANMTREEYLRTPPWERSKGTTKERYVQVFDEAIAQSPDVHVYESYYKRPDGSSYPAEVWRSAINRGGRWLMVVSTRDITERKRAQARVELFANVVNLSSDAVLLIDREQMQPVDANEALCRLQGMTRDNLLKMPPWELLGKTIDQQEQERLFDEIIARAPASVLEADVTIDSTAGPVPVEIQRQAIQVDQRWIIVVTVRDISDRKRSQAHIDRILSAINLSADGLFLIDRETMTYVDVNETACRMLGYGRTELLRRRPHQTSRQLRGLDDIAAVYDRVIEQAPAISSAELLIVNSDGREFPCEVHRQAIQSEGRWIIVATLRDISERKQQQARIERFATVVNLSEDIVLLVRRETMRFIDVNEAACRQYGYSRDELLSMPIEKTTRTFQSADEIAKYYDELIAVSPQVVRAELLEERSDGSTFPAEAHRQAIMSDGGWTIIVTVRNIAERRRAEEEIRKRVVELTRSNQELEQFAYVASHDLSEPLRMVASYTQLLARRYAANFDDDGREFMGYVVSGAQRMKQLIDDLLAYSRAGRSKSEMRLVSLDTALDEALENLAQVIHDTSSTIKRGTLPSLVCEKTGITQLFQNLIGNALKFRTENAPVVRVDAEQLDGSWVVSVADNGIGIAHEYFQRIFVIFQRLHPRTEYEGTGIGLAICKKIVERHDGEIWVESELGHGTTFKFRLPNTSVVGRDSAAVDLTSRHSKIQADPIIAGRIGP